MSSQITLVEIKITLADDIAAACQRLGLDSVEPEPYRLWFCEVVRLHEGVAQPTLSESGLILRLRSRADSDDATVKLRRKGRLNLPAGWDRQLGRTESKYEGDWTGADQHQSASLTLGLPAGSVAAMVERWPPLPRRALSAAQTRFAAAVAGRSRLLLRGAQPLGPVSALKWRGVPGLVVSKDAANRRAAKEVYAERWRIDALDFLELSIQVKARSALRWQERFTARVSETVGLDTGALATKTKLILNHLLGQNTTPQT